MEQEPAAYEVGGGASGHYHEFAEQDEPYKAYVGIVDATVDNGLCEKRHGKLQHASEQKPEEYLGEVTPILLYVADEKPERATLTRLFRFSVRLPEAGPRLK